MTPPAWIDVAADLAMAEAQVARVAEKHASLPTLPPELRADREIAICKHLHDAYSAAEKALERVVELVDGDVPRGRSFHRDLIRRAALPAEGIRPAILTPDTAALLDTLLGFRHVFRHVYGGFAYEKAAPNLGVAQAAIPRLRDEIAAFAAGLGLAPGA